MTKQTQIQVPRSENAVDKSGTFQKYWSSFFEALARKFNGMSKIPAIASPNATDLPTVIALSNELKIQVNAIKTSLNQ